MSFALILGACGPSGDAPSSPSTQAQTQATDDDDNTPVVDPNVPKTTPTTTVPAAGNGNTTGDGNTTASAGTLNLAVHGTAFTPHVGKNLYVGVIDPNAATPAASAVVAHAQIGNDGTANIDFTKVLQANHAYTIAYFADTNMNGACDKGDHQYLAKLPAETADANTTVSHNAAMASVCAMLPTGTLP